MSNINKNGKLLQILHELILNWENEIVEFKQVTNDFSQHDIGKYFSALSNEANLKGIKFGWLVFGVNNETKKIRNTNYRDTAGLETLKHEIAQNATGGLTFADIYEVYDGDNRVVMFKIPAAVKSIPTAWKGHWYGRDGESLVPLSMSELDQIRGDALPDWSAQVIEESDISFLDINAIRIARDKYKSKQKNEHTNITVDRMTDEEFLQKLRLIVNGKLTNAALVLLGKPEYDNRINGLARLMWRFYGSSNLARDYHEFEVPYITLADRVFIKIRNLTYRYMPNKNTLFQTQIPQYDEEMFKELINNCIAHMNYASGGRIYVDEFDDTITISNPGNFIPGNVQNVLKNGYRVPYYRNPLLSTAMRELDMIDTIQLGIPKVYTIQRARYFPMPEYNFDNPNEVSVTIYGKILEKNYTHILFDNPELDLEIVFLLDRVQKDKPITKEQFKHLKQLGYLGGTFKDAYIPVQARDGGQVEQSEVIKSKNDKYLLDLMIKYLEESESTTKAGFIELLKSELSIILDDKQIENKVKNLITKLKKENVTEHAKGNNRTGEWQLVKSDKKPIKNQ